MSSSNKEVILSTYTRDALLQEGVEFVSCFTTGHSGNQVVLAKDVHQQLYVLKIPQDERSQAEVFTNLRGFRAIEENGLGRILPDVRRIGQVRDYTYLVTNYLGENFETKVKTNLTPEALFENLANKMDIVYSMSIKEDGNSFSFINRIQAMLRRNYINHLIPSKLIGPDDVMPYLEFDSTPFCTPTSCFAVFDFTPEDIYIGEDTIKYPDPKADVRGNPTIDLACFAGVSRDVYKLPGSESGYRTLEDLAIYGVSQKLRLTPAVARRLFNLGRALQLSLSARFRVNTDPTLAQTYTDESFHYLQAVVNT